MKRFGKVRIGVAAKLAVCVIASTAAFFSLFGYLNLRVERSQSEALVRQSADRIAGLILRSTRYGMLHNDREALVNIIQELGTQPSIQHIRVSSQDGRVTLSTDPGEVGRRRATAGTAGARIFWGANGQRVLSVSRPIDNAAACASAACHVHPAGQRVLGVIDADLSLAQVDAQIAEHQAVLRWFLFAATALGCLAAVLFMWVVVYQPVKELIDGTHRVADGDLAYRLPVRSDDELGDLAASFNKMTAEVASVQGKIEAEVRRKTAELERVYRTLLTTEKMASIGKLAATVAHEINNPLFGILTYARLVGREIRKHELPNRDELEEQIQTIERESKRCGDLVKNLLTFSRQAPSHREPNELNTIVHRAVLLVKHKLDMQSIELREQLAEGLPPVECDANQIQQVALVLMVNASEAMAKGGVLEVATGYDAGAEQALVRVKDTGSGIPADLLPRIFDPFFTTKEDQNRTGLGLAVAHSIVEQHAGEISVRSTPGEGTEFTVKLPTGGGAGRTYATPTETMQAIVGAKHASPATGEPQWQQR
jgi:two-component system, NtrC family, sensor kinase